MDTTHGMPITQMSNEDIIDNLESCSLCGTKLKFKHHTDYLNLQVHEEASCPSCGIKNKVAQFILQ